MKYLRTSENATRPLVSRRNFLKTGAAVLSVGALSAATSACGHDKENEDNAVVVEENQKIAILDFNPPVEENYKELAVVTLPIGTTALANSATWVCTLTRTEELGVVAKGSLVNLENEKIYTVLPSSIQEESNRVITSMRCTDDLICWLEVDFRSDAWSLYATPFTTEVISPDSTVEVSSGNGDYAPPDFDVFGKRVVWQVSPHPDVEDSEALESCYAWELGNSESTLLYESDSFATPPNIGSNEALVITPRESLETGRHYTMLALDINDPRVPLDSLVLPKNVQPYSAAYTKDGFLFSIEASYGYGGLLGEMGTYIGREHGPFYTLSREPLAQPSFSGGCYIVKNRGSHLVIDIENRSFYRLSAPNNALDWGDFPATSGEASTFVTYSAVKDSATSLPSHVVLRSIKFGALTPDKTVEEESDKDEDEPKPTTGDTYESVELTD